MILDSRDLAAGSTHQYDVCIVGGGAAGITLARALNSDKRSICVLESGGFQREQETQSLYDGLSSGPGLSAGRYLGTSRLRFLGGTTNHWTGFCRPLDAMDLEPRPWIPYSGWPIDRSELVPFYTRATGVLRIEPFDNWGDMPHGDRDVMPPSDALVGKRFHFSAVRFGSVYREELQNARGVTVLLHANVVNLDVDETGAVVRRLRVATLGGKRFDVSARLFVLAAGAVENARLLLISNVGNRSDRVGRYFMDHPVIGTGLVCLTHPDAARKLDGMGGFLGVSASAQREHEILNVCIELNPRRTSFAGESAAGGKPMELREFFYRTATMLGSEIPADSGHDYRYRRCFLYAEPGPYPDSRITLDQETDALGLPRPRLVWKTTSRETKSLQRAKEILAIELGKRQIGRVLVDSDEDAIDIPLGTGPWSGTHPGNHHMGTTRMSARPADGVVDRNCQVHDMANLFVAGSSVFPTAGFANPTFTLVALALRLADHLVTRLEH